MTISIIYVLKRYDQNDHEVTRTTYHTTKAGAFKQAAEDAKQILQFSAEEPEYWECLDVNVDSGYKRSDGRPIINEYNYYVSSRPLQE
jgi:hypothetical protein